jgi:ComF family protein
MKEAGLLSPPRLLELLFPPACAACGSVLPAKAPFCLRCDLAIERLPALRCLRCAEPGDFSRRICPRCESRPPPFARAFAPFAHQGPIARAVHRFKYEDHPELARPLTEQLQLQARAFIAQAPRCVCAVPLHRSRFWQRRYDQAQLLARELARCAQLQELDALTRTRHTRRQVGLHEGERERNVAGAFAVSKEVQGRRLLLIDDVFTTGATVRAAASVLLEAGAMEVQVLTIARAFAQP